ncbi:Spc98 family-domain-containing protein [Amylostereum chailletii]|nr:Spc98 family-domain-containing protein [Amylostereum chailletii]
MERSKPTPLSIDPTFRRHRALSGASSIRPSSSASFRPPSSASSRPPSSASIRPSSSGSIRLSSSASTNRPASSASFRPLSQASHRPPSRFSIRSARQTSRLQSFGQTLVKKLSPDDDEENVQAAVEFVVKSLDYTTKAGPTIDMDTMNKRISGHTRKARIQSRDTWADALDMLYARLKSQVEEAKDLDQEITLVRLPDHLQLLILLSSPPDEYASRYARDYLENARNPPSGKDGPTWKEILDEEPFEGQHWEGVYGLPPGSTIEGWESKSLESTPPLSPLVYEGFDNPRAQVSPLNWDSPDADDDDVHVPLSTDKEPKQQFHPSVSYDHRQDVESLQTHQYWRKEWKTDASLSGDFVLGDASTLGPSLSHVLGEIGLRAIDSPSHAKYIHEHDAVREVLMALEGHKNLLMRWCHGTGSNFSFELTPDAPRVVHLTITSQHSILKTFAQFATTVEHLRKFVSRIFDFAIQPGETSKQLPHFTGYNRRITRTVEAFSEAVDLHIQSFTKWCSSKEEDICKATSSLGSPVTISFLGLEMSLRDSFSQSFDVLLDVIRRVMRKTSRVQDRDAEVWMLAELPAYSPPSAISSLLLDSLLETAQENLVMGNSVTHKVLMRVFIMAAEPIWTMVGHWLRDGMPIQEAADRRATPGYAGLVDEFFVEDNQLFLLDPDYWSEGFVLRDRNSEGERAPSPIPAFLDLVASQVLGAGKAVGLMRALGLPLEYEGDEQPSLLPQWPSFTSLFNGTNLVDSTRITSVDDLSRFVYDELISQCRTVQGRLVQVVVDECELWYHLSAIEDLYLMRRGDVMSRVFDVVFAKMDAQQAWSDYHFLNSTLRDVIQATARKWINPNLVQLFYRGGRDAANQHSAHAMDDLFMEYAAPFPLTYIFGPSSLDIYSSIFVFLIKIRRAKGALERILVRGAADAPHMREEMKVFYAMRSKLSWFVNSLLDFVSTYVLQSQVVKFHDSLRLAKSLDDIIHLHDTHLRRLEDLCLLQDNTSTLRRTVHSILNISLHFADIFVAFAGDTTHDLSHTHTPARRHRSRRLQQQRKNTIGFSMPVLNLAQSSDSDSDSHTEDEDPLNSEGPQTSFSLVASVSLGDEDLYGQVNQMSRDLDGSVRFFRRGMESLAGGTSEAAPAFGIFAFTLEDWDR